MWSFIGTLDKNKAREDTIHTIKKYMLDRLDMARHILSEFSTN